MAASEQRNRTIMIGIIGLCVILLATVTTCQSRKEAPEPVLGEAIVRLGDMPVAQVNGTAIYESDVRSVAIEQGKIEKDAQLPQGDPVFVAILNELIDQRIMALAALERSLDQEKSAKRRLAQARERILSNVLVEEHLRETVTDDAARQIFDAQAELRDRGMEIRARHIQLADLESAKNIIARLDKGESFESLALAFSTDRASRENSGDLGYFTNDMLDPEFTRVVFSAEIKAPIPVFQTEAGWHVAEVLDRRRARQPDFEEMRDDIISQMTYNQIKTLLDELRAAAQVKRLKSPAENPPLSKD